MRTRVVHGRMATASVWKEEEIKDSLPCREFSEFKVSFLVGAFSLTKVANKSSWVFSI